MNDSNTVKIESVIDLLKKPFPDSSVSWRAGGKPYNGKCQALAYIDARDVMDRLDDVVGYQNWQCTYPHAEGKTVCSIGIKIDGEWVWKSDGAGDSDVEAEKGALSDAFKRAAVRWGIGRYLYQDEYKGIWVECEVVDGKIKKLIGDPWIEVNKRLNKQNKPTTQQPVMPKSLTEEDRRGAAEMWVEQQIKHFMGLPEYDQFLKYTNEIYNPRTKDGKHFLALTKYPELKDLIDAKLQEKQDEFKQQGRM